MKIVAKLNYFRISPRKARLVADCIRGMDAEKAEIQLRFLNKKAAGPVLKLLKSSIANAQNNFGVEKEDLFISEIQVNEGPVLKRWRARAMGRAASIMKRTSHIIITLDTKKKVEVKKKEEKKPEVVKLDTLDALKDKEKPEEKIKEEKGSQVEKPEMVQPPRPYDATSKSKKKFWSRQTFGNIKKAFRRKSF